MTLGGHFQLLKPPWWVEPSKAVEVKAGDSAAMPLN